jgi:hypothetical protein
MSMLPMRRLIVEVEAIIALHLRSCQPRREIGCTPNAAMHALAATVCRAVSS